MSWTNTNIFAYFLTFDRFGALVAGRKHVPNLAAGALGTLSKLSQLRVTSLTQRVRTKLAARLRKNSKTEKGSGAPKA